VRQDGSPPCVVTPSVTPPGSGERAVPLAVAACRPWVGERPGAGVRPTRAGGRLEGHPACNPRVDPVPAVEVDPIPVDETRPGPRGGDSQGVVLEHRPGVALRHSAGPRVEPDRHPLVRDVPAAGPDLERAGQGRTVVRPPPWLAVWR